MRVYAVLIIRNVDLLGDFDMRYVQNHSLSTFWLHEADVSICHLY